jgi:hypothetical protein
MGRDPTGWKSPIEAVMSSDCAGIGLAGIDLDGGSISARATRSSIGGCSGARSGCCLDLA